MRNSTTKLTVVSSVSPSSSRNAVGIATIAMISGSTARGEANTTASTASAPSPPITVSTNTPLPPPVPVEDCSWLIPVGATLKPGGSAAWTAAAIPGVGSGIPKPACPVNTRMNALRPSAVRNRGLPVVPYPSTR